MCPIHESDSAEERWSRAEWEHYELWEKVEARARKLRRLWVSVAIFLFLVLSAIPVVREHRLRWKSLRAARELSQHLNHLKSEAAFRQNAFRVRLDSRVPLQLLVEWGPSCRSPLFWPTQEIRLLKDDSEREALSWVFSKRAKELGILGLLEDWCFHPVEGSYQTPKKEDLAAFLVTPVKELAPDQGAFTWITGTLGEISFE